MAADTEVRTFSDLYTEVLNKMRQATNITAITNQAKRYVNTALHEMVFGFEYKLPWLERQAVLITAAPYQTGTVAITRGSTSLVGTDTLWNTANVYGVNNVRTTGKFVLDGPNLYGVASVGSDTAVTLATRYVADANLAAGATYTYFEDEYALASDFLKPVDYRRFSSAYNIPIIGRNEFQRMYPRPNISGLPKVATILDKPFSGSTTPVTLVQFYPYPNANLLIPYSYITKNLAVSAAGAEATSMSADTDEPALPVRYRNLLVDYAISKWYRDKKDDARSESAKADYQEGVNRVVGDQRIGANTQAKITPRPGTYNTRSIYGSRRGVRYSTNNSFDDFRT